MDRSEMADGLSSDTLDDIPFLNVPWLQHDHFPLTKKLCSTVDGVATATKNSLHKVVQELKRGRTHVEQQLTQLESELVTLTDYLNSSAPSQSFPAQLLVPPGTVFQGTMQSASGLVIQDSGGEHQFGLQYDVDKMAGVLHEAEGKAIVTSDKANPLNPISPLVEDDLASDTPCTTTGLWQYLCAYHFFKTITPEDMEQALQLEDPSPSSIKEKDAPFDDTSTASSSGNGEMESVEVLPKKAVITQTMDDFLKQRLVASIFPVAFEKVHERNESDETMEETPDEDNIVKSEDNYIGSGNMELDSTWNSHSVTAVLREIGLLDMDDEIVEKYMANPEDDEVYREIRLLEKELAAQILQNNERKRVLRLLMEKMKPWLSTQQEDDKAIEKKYLKMWRRKRELERKKKLKEKKVMRREVLRNASYQTKLHAQGMQ